MADTAGEPRRIIPALGPYYDNARDYTWLLDPADGGWISC